MTTRVQKNTGLVGASILVAALSSACCWLPLLAVGLGFSALGVGSIFEAYRWPLIAVAGLSIVGAVVLQRRSQLACERDGCRPARGRGLLWPIVGAVFVVSFATFPEVLAWSTSSSGDADAKFAVEPASPLVRSYSVKGMTCEGCTPLLVSYLEDQKEIANATVSYETATTRVEFATGVEAKRADSVMVRVSKDWDGKYEFTPKPNT